MKLGIIALSLAAMSLSACGTITRGSNEVVKITAEPSHAVITTSLGHTCTSPCEVKVSRKTEFTVFAEAEGYVKAQQFVGTRVSGKGGASMAGNLIAGGIIGGVVDASTGASRDHFPNPVRLVLQRPSS